MQTPFVEGDWEHGWPAHLWFFFSLELIETFAVCLGQKLKQKKKKMKIFKSPYFLFLKWCAGDGQQCLSRSLPAFRLIWLDDKKKQWHILVLSQYFLNYHNMSQYEIYGQYPSVLHIGRCDTLQCESSLSFLLIWQFLSILTKSVTLWRQVHRSQVKLVFQGQTSKMRPWLEYYFFTHCNIFKYFSTNITFHEIACNLQDPESIGQGLT